MGHGIESFGWAGALGLQGDGAYGVLGVLRRIAAARKARTQVGRTPTRSSTSNGFVERLHQNIQGLTRSMKAQTERGCADRLRAAAAIVPWMARHGTTCCLACDDLPERRGRHDGPTASAQRPVRGQYPSLGCGAAEAKSTTQRNAGASSTLRSCPDCILGEQTIPTRTASARAREYSFRVHTPRRTGHMWDKECLQNLKGVPRGIDREGEESSFLSSRSKSCTRT